MNRILKVLWTDLKLSGKSVILQSFVIILSLLLSKPANGQVRINEVLAVNATFNYDTQYYNYSSWIELHNTGSSAVNIGGYYLSDSKTNHTKWRVPSNTTIAANSYVLIWCDSKNAGLHTNYEIDPDGEGIYFYTSTLAFLDSVHIPKQYSNISYGRPANGSTWGYLLTPTPNSVNNSNDINGQLLPPTFSLSSGRYASSISLSLTPPFAGTQIRYTIDGTEPNMQSALYSSALTISQTTVVKAKIFTSFAIPSETVTRTYFINEHAFTLPVVSVSMNPTFLWDNTIGIYVAGTNGITGNCSDNVAKNYNQDWGRHCVVEYFNPAGISEFKKDFETKIYGACSRHFFDQKSLAFYARREFGKSHLEYPLFSAKKIDKFDTFVLRNSGNDNNVTQFRDILMQEIVQNSFDLDWQAYQPAAVYLNGSYWGIMNLREKLNENYIEHNSRIDGDSIHFLEGNMETIKGSNSEYSAFLNQLGTMKLWEKATFDYINSRMDVTEFINYYITQIYYGNTDWPGNNIKYWKPVKQNNKWRWILFDTDFGFGLFTYHSTATHKTLNYVTDSTTTVYWPNPQWSTLLFRRLLKNPQFKEQFIQTFQTSVASIFNPTRVNKLIDSISGLYAAEMVYHKAKWGGTITDWNNSVLFLKTFARERNAFISGHIKEFFNLTGYLANFSVDVLQPNSGKIALNNVYCYESTNIQLYQNLPYTISAIPANGYTFKKWHIKTQNSVTENLIIKGDTWKYNDLGQDLTTDWVPESYNDASWPTGQAQFGYGENDERTTISFGPNASNKYITTYFRKNITIADTANSKKATLSLLCDDGAIIYINGTEAARYNMPATATYITLASSAATENIYLEFSINPNLFKNGNNCIAVEIHQNAATSSDLSFDMDLTLVKTTSGIEYTSNKQTLADTVKSDIIFSAEFQAKTPISNIVINEIAPTKSGITDNYGNPDDWFELYNSGTDTLDLTGLFLTDKFSRKNKFEIRNNGAPAMKLAPQGYKVFWADEQEHQGNNHASFKLSGSGERIGIYQVIGADTLVLDTVTYSIQKDLFTWGRYPNGTGTFQFLNCITPEDSNSTNCQPSPVFAISDNTRIKVYPNPASTYFIIELPDNTKHTNYIIYNQLGKSVLSGTANNQSIDCSNLPSGVYLLLISIENKYTTSRKIMITR